MKKIICFSFIINIILSFEKSDNKLNDITKKEEKEKYKNFLKYNNISIISNIKLEQNFIDISNIYLSKKVSNNYSLSYTKKYFLLKLIINKYIRYPYHYNSSLNNKDFYEFYYEYIFFQYNIIKNSVLIDVLIYFYKERNILLNNGIIIFVKKYFVIYQNPFLIYNYTEATNLNENKINLNEIYKNTLINIFSIVIKIINLIYSLNILISFCYEEKISIHAICIELYAISFYFHFYYFSHSFEILMKLYNQNYSWKIKFINIFDILASYGPQVFDGTILLWCLIGSQKKFETKIAIIYSILSFGLISLIFFSLNHFIGLSETFIILVCIIWGCQIIHNSIFENKYIYGLFYIIIFTLEKLLFIDFIIKYKNYSRPSKTKKIIIVSINIFNIIFLYIQRFFGFCSKSINKNHELNKTLEELLNEKRNAKNEICSICLTPILNNDNNKYCKINCKKLKKILKIIFKNFFFIFILYEYKCEGEYSLIPCGHIFHAKCLRPWHEQNKKCPLCRTVIQLNYN